MSNFARIIKISVKNFKNIASGNISDLEFSASEPSLLGIYGQNGSGKTSIVEACLLLKYLMSGFKIPDTFTQTISFGQDCAEFSFSFCFTLPDQKEYAHVDYDFKIGKQQQLSQDGGEIKYQVKIFDEVIKVSCASAKGFSRKKKIIDTSLNDTYSPQAILKSLKNKIPNVEDELKKIKFLAQNSAVSSIFNDRTINLFLKSTDLTFNNILSTMKVYALTRFFVVTTRDQNSLDFGLLTLNFSVEEKKLQAGEKTITSLGQLVMPLTSRIQIPVAHAKLMEKAFASLNTVITKIIPELKIELLEKGLSTDANGQEVCNLEVLSVRNDVKIPLVYESNGIKKLISILQLIVAVYNQPDVTVAIDELDAGIFEYLLGEILSIVASHGRGQLFFTSHNLRPLEVLDKKYLCFTTVNPRNRFLRLRGIKSNNNLRDFYYRDIQMGIQEESLYDNTNNAQIALSLYKAGHTQAI